MDLLALLRRQQALGQVANADVLLQEAALAQDEQTLPPLEKQLALQRILLTALAGRFPSNEVAEKFNLAALRLPRSLPVSVPSKLVEQRPDVRAAEANLQSASAQVGVAIADRLPVVNLTANGGYSAANVNSLFLPQTAMWSLAGSVAHTIFDGFSLYHKQKAAEAAYEQADAQYRSVVITSFQNVADSLRAIQSDARALQAAVKAEDAASKSLDLVRKQAEEGAVNILAILTVQRSYLLASITRIQALTSRYTDTAALFQALGGGWWNRTDVEPYDAAKPELDAIIPVKAFQYVPKASSHEVETTSR
jgi:NodT family efflux transporter outer membrane factor (OMF) lipoprotein